MSILATGGLAGRGGEWVATLGGRDAFYLQDDAVKAMACPMPRHGPGFEAPAIPCPVAVLPCQLCGDTGWIGPGESYELTRMMALSTGYFLGAKIKAEGNLHE